MASSLEEFLARPVFFTLPGMDEVEIRKDLVYRGTGDAGLGADVYLPQGLDPTERRPAVIFVHGDASPEVLKDAKEWGAFVSWGKLAAASGLVGVTFNHASSEQRTKLHEAAGDVDALIEFVLVKSNALHVNPDRIALSVFSMGPPVGLRTALRERPEFLRCIVSYYGAMDLRPLRAETVADVSDEVLREFSPLHQLKSGTGRIPPMLIARAGLEERPWLNPTIDEFVAEALSRGVEIDLLNHPGGRHAFDILDDDERTRDIIARTLQFLGKHLLGTQWSGSRIDWP
jgi:acetyl esterase/lipase